MTKINYQVKEIPETGMVNMSLPEGSSLKTALRYRYGDAFDIQFVEQDAESPLQLLIFNLSTEKRFFDGRILSSIINNYRKVFKLNVNQVTNNANDYRPIPIIIIYNGEESFKRNSHMKVMFGIQYWDSSIWQHWLDCSGPDYKQNLKETLNQIAFCYQRSFYSKAEAVEFCEFSTRQYLQSYIVSIDKRNNNGTSVVSNSGHAGEIVPFPFFEESSFFAKYQKSWLFLHNDLTGSKYKQLKWRVLLIDDKTERLDEIRRLFQSKAYGNKFEIIENEQDDTHTKPALFIEQVCKMQDVCQRLEKNYYDIILLDFLLDKDPQSHNRNFGTDLFPQQDGDKIRLKSPQIKMGPNNKLWIFLTSCYSNAFLDALRQRGVTFNNERWNIERGADPVNTPNAFLFYLTRFMEVQVSMHSSTDTNIRDIWRQALDQLHDTQFTRVWASLTLTKILNYSANIQALKGISTGNGKSLFAQSFFTSAWYGKFLSEQDSGLYGALTHMLFLLASGDGHNWNEMKTDLEIVKRKVPGNTGYDKVQDWIEKLQEQYL